jgi:hypothetical protein
MAAHSSSEASLMVFEGVTSQSSSLNVETKYKPDAAMANAAVGGNTKFQIIIGQNFKDMKARLERDATAFDLALIRPSNISGQMIKSFGYQPLAVADAPSGVAFVVKKDSTIEKLAGASKARFIMADPESAMVKLAFVEMKTSGLNKDTLGIQHTWLQDMVVYSVESGLADIGTVNYQQAALYEAKGSKVIHCGKEVPGVVLLASKKN